MKIKKKIYTIKKISKKLDPSPPRSRCKISDLVMIPK